MPVGSSTQTQDDEQSGEVKKPPTQQQADDEALHPDQGSHLVFSPAKLGLEPEECLLVCEKESLKRSDDPLLDLQIQAGMAQQVLGATLLPAHISHHVA